MHMTVLYLFWTTSLRQDRQARMMAPTRLAALLLALQGAHAATSTRHTGRSGTESVPIDLTAAFNNKAFGRVAGEAAFDILNQSYAAPALTTNGSYTSTQTGIQFEFPGYRPGNASDNVICDSQVFSVPAAQYFSASFLVASDVELTTVSGNVTFTYIDNSTSTTELRSEPWFAFLTINRGEIVYPYRFTANGTNGNTSHIFEITSPLSTGKNLSTIELPSTTNTTIGRLHVFAMTLWQGSQVSVQSVRPTQQQLTNGSQLVEVTLNNAGSSCLSGSGLKVELSGPGITTTQPGQLRRLCPGDQKTVKLGVYGSYSGWATVALDDGELTQKQHFEVDLGLTNWTSDLSNLARHESPDWFDGAKFGIFIHWGPYSVTGWGNSTPYESYAEWFWWYSTHHPEADRSDFYDYRLRTYGPDWNYDDTFEDYTASKFDAKEWVDLFADAGATYFVLTTKHHDGFANFDTKETTNRSSLHYGPKRDLLAELFDAAKEYQPTLRRGTYFSLPEWFNPNFAPYGYSQLATNSSTTWPGIIARNPYTGLEEPYTGGFPVNDFVADIMVPQMEILAYDYETDIMWCDCGAANGTAAFASDWWNKAREQGREVTINSRCGVAEVADFDTPEYATFSTSQPRKWESNQGMDPFSYGYNRATDPSAYMNVSTLIFDLVDMVSKNGNFLLDIGPRADGSIVETEANTLREAGKWIHAHSEAIFNTTYWFVTPEVGANIRFTQTNEAFYIFTFEKPANGTLRVEAPVPILEGDEVTMVGSGNGSMALDWLKDEDGYLTIDTPMTLVDSEDTCWVFKVAYGL